MVRLDPRAEPADPGPGLPTPAEIKRHAERALRDLRQIETLATGLRYRLARIAGRAPGDPTDPLGPAVSATDLAGYVARLCAHIGAYTAAQNAALDAEGYSEGALYDDH